MPHGHVNPALLLLTSLDPAREGPTMIVPSARLSLLHKSHCILDDLRRALWFDIANCFTSDSMIGCNWMHQRM